MTTPLASFLAAPLERVHLSSTLTYRRFGRGPAVVLVHGWPLNGATYRGLVQHLAQRYTCYVPDLPGSGDTPWDPTTRDIFSDWGKLIAEFVVALGLTQVALVGHDSGGGIAREAALLLGDRVRMLGLIDTEVSNHQPGLVRLYKLLARLPGCVPLMRMLLGQRWFARSRLGFGACFRNPSHVLGEFHDACLAPLLPRLPNAMQALRCADLTGTRWPKVHARISAPSVLIYGERDLFFPVDLARAMVDELPDVRAFHVLPEQALFAQDEAPELVAGALLPWLDKLHAPTVALDVASA